MIYSSPRTKRYRDESVDGGQHRSRGALRRVHPVSLSQEHEERTPLDLRRDLSSCVSIRAACHADAVPHSRRFELAIVDPSSICLLYTSTSPRDRQKSRM